MCENRIIQMRQENRSINVLKGIACLAVVLNHFHGSRSIGNIMYVFSHIGVPVFFMISGYYLYSGPKTLEKLPKKIRHIGKLFILHIAICILDFVVQRIVLMNNLVRKDVVVHDIILLHR